MINPTPAVLIVVGFILVFGVAVPVFNKKAPKYISYRWCVVVVLLALLIGAVIDFGDLNDTARQIVLVGGLVVSGLYVLLRTVEKALANGWLNGAQIEAKKGDISVKVTGKDGGKDEVSNDRS